MSIENTTDDEMLARYVANVPRPVRIIAAALDYSPSLYLPYPSNGVVQQATALWEKLKAEGYGKEG